MKQKIFTFLLIVATGLTACKKTQDQPDIKAYDQDEIQKYMAANNLSGFTEDTTPEGTGTTGIHYKILSSPATGDTLKYSDQISLVYTIKSFDGKFVRADTITNHMYQYLGHLTSIDQTNGFYLPYGVQLAVHNLLQYKGASMRVLIPSHLGYGKSGFGSGSSSNTTTRVAGNQGLDLYVNVIGDQAVYDDKVITKYIATNNLTGFVKDPLGYYYKIVTPGSDTEGTINEFSKLTITYGGSLLNTYSFDYSFYNTSTVYTPAQFTDYGVEAAKHALINHGSKGRTMQLLIPSTLGFGTTAQAGIPANSVLKFDFTIIGIDL